jgi:hypothetical protein
VNGPSGTYCRRLRLGAFCWCVIATSPPPWFVATPSPPFVFQSTPRCLRGLDSANEAGRLHATRRLLRGLAQDAWVEKRRVTPSSQGSRDIPSYSALDCAAIARAAATLCTSNKGATRTIVESFIKTVEGADEGRASYGAVLASATLLTWYVAGNKDSATFCSSFGQVMRDTNMVSEARRV